MQDKQPPDPALMQQARDFYAHAAACDAAGLKDEAHEAQKRGTAAWLSALRRKDLIARAQLRGVAP